MTIDEAIKHQRYMTEKYKYQLVLNETGNPMFSLGNREIHRIEKYVEEYEQIANWLEKLKAIETTESRFTNDLLNMGFTEGYNKAIEDCNKIIENAFDDNIINSIAYACITMNFEQLKSGGENEID